MTACRFWNRFCPYCFSQACVWAALLASWVGKLCILCCTSTWPFATCKVAKSENYHFLEWWCYAVRALPLYDTRWWFDETNRKLFSFTILKQLIIFENCVRFCHENLSYLAPILRRILPTYFVDFYLEYFVKKFYYLNIRILWNSAPQSFIIVCTQDFLTLTFKGLEHKSAIRGFLEWLREVHTTHNNLEAQQQRA